MSTLNARDLAQIKKIVENNTEDMDFNFPKFNGSHENAVEWMDQFEYRAKANGWDDQKIRLKLPIYLTNT